MKKILLAISMMLSLMACVNEVITLPSETVDTDGEVVLNLSAVVPEAQIATKGTFATPTITSLNVLMFDDKGFIVANAVALNEDESEWTAKNVTDDIVKFKVTLPKTGNSCTLHFVANADVSTVEYGMETDVITSLATAGTKDAYWQKVNLPRLIDEGDLTAKCPVQLIRNHAKVTLVSSVKTFKPTGYALINYPTSGTVAPYNTTSGAFQIYNEGNKGKDFENLVAEKYTAFMPARCVFTGYDNITWTALNVANDGVKVSGDPLYTYESTYGNTFLMVKGIFDYDKDGNFEEDESYYKIDFYDPSLGNCDILRNINYQFAITNVIGPGYSTPAAAADPEVPAGNNISNSLLTQSLINISDGTQRLSVEYTTKYLTSDDEFTLKYMFEPNIKAETTTTNNKLAANDGPIEITAEVTDDHHSKPITLTVSDENNISGYSVINITPQDFPEKGQIFKKRITIKSTYDGTTMNRVVDLFFINPYSMDVACDPKRVADAAGQPITVNTVIPGDLPSALFPLVFEIEAEAMSLYPNTAKSDVTDDSKIMPVVSGKSIIPGKTKNTFHYERTLTLAEYDSLGGKPDKTNDNTVTVPSYFLTNKAESASKVYVYNEYFNSVYDSFVNFEAKYFTNLAFPNGVKATVGSPTTFNFTIASNAPQSMTVTLNGLVPASTETKLNKVAGTENKYTYSNPGTGNKTLNLQTVKASATVSVELEADAYDYVRASLSAVQANEVVIPAGKISFSNLNLDYVSSRTIYVYSDSNYSNQITSFSLSSDPGTNPELNLGDISDDQTIYFRYNRMGSSHTVSATVAQLKAGCTLKFK